MLWYAGRPLFSALPSGRYVEIHCRTFSLSRCRSGGWSNDCIWMRSSFTIPLEPSEMLSDTERSSPAGAGDIDRPPRVVPMASISSMNPMAPPFLRADLRSSLKNERTFTFVMP